MNENVLVPTLISHKAWCDKDESCLQRSSKLQPRDSHEKPAGEAGGHWGDPQRVPGHPSSAGRDCAQHGLGSHVFMGFSVSVISRK